MSTASRVVELDIPDHICNSLIWFVMALNLENESVGVVVMVVIRKYEEVDVYTLPIWYIYVWNIVGYFSGRNQYQSDYVRIPCIHLRRNARGEATVLAQNWNWGAEAQVSRCPPNFVPLIYDGPSSERNLIGCGVRICTRDVYLPLSNRVFDVVCRSLW